MSSKKNVVSRRLKSARLPRRRGRPPKNRDHSIETRELLLRAGLEALTVKGFVATSIEEVLKSVSVPKGSFYHYFDSKEAFGLALIERYADYFAKKIDRHIANDFITPIERLRAFVDDARSGMARHDFHAWLSHR